MTWFACINNAGIMSEPASQTPETLETIGVQEIQALKYIVTISHDWLVKRVFVYIIEKRVIHVHACWVCAECLDKSTLKIKLLK